MARPTAEGAGGSGSHWQWSARRARCTRGARRMSWTNSLKRSAARAEAVTASQMPSVSADDPKIGVIVNELRRHLVEFSDGRLRAEEIEPKCHLFDYGYIDSLTAVRLLAVLEED